MKLHNPELKFGKETMLFNSEHCQKHYNTPSQPSRIRAVPNIPAKDRPKNVVRKVTELKPKELDIQPVSLRAVSMYARRGLTVYQISLEQVDAALENLDSKQDAAIELPDELKDFSDVFSPKEAEKLLPHRPYNHDIKLKDSQNPP